MSELSGLKCAGFALLAAGAGYLVCFLTGTDAPCLSQSVAWEQTALAGGRASQSMVEFTSGNNTYQIICTGTDCAEIKSCTLPPPPDLKAINIDFIPE